MPIEDKITVAIELGSSKVTAIAGRKQPDGAIQVLAYAQEPSESFIRKGRINNFNKMTSCIDSIKKKLETTLNKSINATYVGIGGMGMHTVANTVTRRLGEKQLITTEMVNNVKDSNNSMPGGDREILEVVPQDYLLGTQTVSDPVGIASDVIEGHFLNIISSTSVTESVNNCFRNAHIKVVGMPISVLTLADAILTEPEKRSGCVFVDMGAETTTVAVFKNNILRHFAVIPLGGASINRDLCTLQIEENEAESLKRKHAVAYREDPEAEHDAVVLSDGRSVAYDEFNGLVEARVEEIVLNINHQISLSGYDKSKLIAGIVITGGAAGLKGMSDAFTKFTGFEKQRTVKNMRLQYRVEPKGQGNFNADGSFNAAIALIDKGETNCCGGELGTQTSIFGDELKPDTDTAEQTAATTAGTATTGTANTATGGNAGKPADGKAPAEADTHAHPEEDTADETTGRKKSGGFFTGIKNAWNKISNAAGRMVNDDEERFPTNHSNSEK